MLFSQPKATLPQYVKSFRLVSRFLYIYFKELRQGIVALTRHCIDATEKIPNIMSANELIAGHSVTVALLNNGVDSTVGLGD